MYSLQTKRHELDATGEQMPTTRFGLRVIPAGSARVSASAPCAVIYIYKTHPGSGTKNFNFNLCATIPCQLRLRQLVQNETTTALHGWFRPQGIACPSFDALSLFSSRFPADQSPPALASQVTESVRIVQSSQRTRLHFTKTTAGHHALLVTADVGAKLRGSH